MANDDAARQSNGRFAKGNPGGPGRPRRSVEREYLAALSAAVSVSDWARIVEKAKEDAISGDSRAREWLAKHLLGKEPASLLDLAGAESAEVSVEDEIGQRAEKLREDRNYAAMIRMLR